MSLRRHPVLFSCSVLLFWAWSGLATSPAQAVEPASPSVALTPEEHAWLQEHPVIQLAPDPDFRPIEYFDETGAYRGAAADIVRLLEARLGIRLTIVHLKNWDEVMDRFQRHEVDLLGAIVRTPNRETFALFTDTLVSVPGGIFTRAETPGRLTLADLAGRKVAVVSNYTAHDVLRTQYPHISLDVVPDVSTGLAKVSLGMVDAYVENMANASFYSQEAGITNLRLAGTTDFDYRWCIGIRKDWPELQGILNKGLAAISEADRREAISRWISIKSEWRPSRAFLYGSAASILALLLAVSGLWNQRLRKARAVALANQERFKALFQNIGDPIYIADQEGRLLAANEQASRELGYPPEELLGMALTEVDAPGQPKPADALVGESFRRQTNTFETAHRRKDGSCFPVEVNVRVIEYGGRPAVLGVARNITERREAEAALRRSERLHRAVHRVARAFLVREGDREVYEEVLDAILEAAGSPLGAVGYIDQEGALRCPATTREDGLAREPGDQPMVLPAAAWGDSIWGEALRTGVPRFTNAPSRVPGGAAAVERCLAVPLMSQGSAIGVLTVANKPQEYTDEDLATLEQIGEQFAPLLQARLDKETADKALHHQVERLRLYFDRMPTGCIVWGPDRRVRTWNPAAERIFEFSAAEAVGKTPGELIFPASRGSEIDEVWNRLVEGDASAQRVNENVTRSGRTIRCRWTNTPFRDVSGKPGGVLSMVEDITDQQRAQEERRRLEEQMRHAQKLESLGVLAGGIAHDFNNILMSIMGNADLALLKVSPESPVAGNLRTIERAAGRAADLAAQMLAYSGKGRFIVQKLDVNELVGEMAHMLEVSISKKAFLRCELAETLPAVEADATQLRQIIMNLVINASEAIGDEGGVITITTGCRDCDSTCLPNRWLDQELPEGLYVSVEVSDTGCGMDRDTQAKIFDPFYTTKFTGRGLGLAAVLGIVRGHKGAIDVESEPGKGTTFRVLLPAAGPGSARVGRDAESSAWKGSGVVLLVDDEETVRAVGAEMLRILGFEVVTAADGWEALEIYGQRNDIRLVILDLTMPRLDGEQTFRELRRMNAAVRVILATGYGEQAVNEKFRGQGLAGFLQKPYKLSTLREVLRVQ
jgi:PAS domain S-box-containing protein